MAAADKGEGEKLQRAQARRSMTIKGILFVLGMIIGGYIGSRLVVGDELDLTAPWPPMAALAMAVAYLGAMIFGSLALTRTMDELERMHNYKAVAFAGAVYIILYPAWFLLWKGGFVAEPIHWALFVAFWLSLLGSYVWYRFR